MADLTSLYRNNPKRDITIQACADCLHKVGIMHPDEFKKGYFTDYFDIAGGTQPPKSKFIFNNKDGYIRFLQIRDFASENTPTYIPISKNNKLCNENDIVLGRYGASVGKILTGKSGAYNVACAKIILLTDEVDRDYLFYWLHSSYFQNYITSISRSAQGGFNKNDLSRIVTLFPSVELQKRFVSILKQIDNSILNNSPLDLNNIEVYNNIESKYIQLVSKFLSIINENEDLSTELTHQLSLVKQLRQSFLREAMQGKLTAEFRSANPELIAGENSAQALLEKIKAEKKQLIKEGKLKKEKELAPVSEDEIPFEIPESWRWCRLGEICLVKVGSTPSRQVSEFWNGGTIPWVSSGEVANNYIDSTKELITQKGFESTSLIIYPKDSVLVAMIGQGKTRGQTAILKIDATTNQNVAGLIKYSSYLLSKILWYFFLSRYEVTRSGASGGNQPALNGIKISNTVFALPTFSEQQAIVSKLDELMRTCDELEASIRSSQGQNEMLLQQVLREALEG